MPIHAAICDDSSEACALLREYFLSWAKEKGETTVCECFSSAEAFLFRYAEEKAFDLLLLDIEMEKMDGVTLAKTVRCKNKAVQIIFITGYSDYITEGYEVEALHYLMKPVNREKLFLVFDRAAEKCRQNERCLFLETQGEMARVPFCDILYLDVYRNYTGIHAKETYTVKRTLAEFEKELDERFFRVGRGLIVNLKYVTRVTRTEVFLSDIALPLPRGAYETLNRAIIRYT